MPVPLTYDTLPPHSRLRREFSDGVLKIFATAEEPNPAVIRTAMIRSAIPAAMICLAVLVVGFAIFGSMYQANRRYLPEWLSVVLGVAFIVLCAALFALIWRIQYASRMEQIEQALQQSTIIAASPARLLIETAGPLGTASHDLKHDLQTVRITSCAAQPNVECLQIVLHDGTRIEVLPGRDRTELNWIMRELTLALRAGKHSA